MSELLQRIAEKSRLDGDVITTLTHEIHDQIVDESPYIDDANFNVIHPQDLARLFDAYDEQFFDGQIRVALADAPLTFRFSKRMTSAGGKMTRTTDRKSGSKQYEIAISSALLYNCFRDDDHRPITTSGIECRDRMEALQRVFEHEIIHLVEAVVWNASSCSGARFHGISHRLFGHTDYTHALITPRERSYAQYGIHAGVVVCFEHEGVTRTGVVSRVTKRATVLVEAESGPLYNDGKRYAKYYVPTKLLKVVS